ncbi:hypothetical protein [Paraburkholderia sp. PGU19]|uniref:hypothetical protein n=1 Tax=Paraburkholderia sp. PGU19 TaxID=2735434 RepID=UPI0015DA2685|nr:hypothetical protein [Paraburkholderia sp. PGU19]
MRGLERDGLIEQHDRYHVLQADIRDFTVVYDPRLCVRNAHNDGSNVVRVYFMLFEDIVHCIQWRLDGRADLPLLDVRSGNFVAIAKVFDQFVLVRNGRRACAR